MPKIIDDELFERVQMILDRNKKAPARTRGKGEYLLTTKLFCGHCREMMTGYGGTGRSGKAYRYYACKNAKAKKCDKKIVNKQDIEDRIILECRKLLTESNIERIAEAVAAACKADYDSSAVNRIKKAIKEADHAVENLWLAIEKGGSVEMFTERIEKRKQEKIELEISLTKEMNKQVVYTAPQVRTFLYSLKNGNFNDERNRKGIVNVFLEAVYLSDDRFTMLLNGGEDSITIDDILLDEVEENITQQTCSSMTPSAPPIKPPNHYG